jgi:pyruvate ferredoxin oxidoreductase gamma subunit
MISVRWHGRGGQGCFTAARILGASAVNEGLYALAFPSFGPERRGAPVLGFTKIDYAPVTDRSEIKSCDFIVVMDDSILDENVVRGLNPKGAVIVNTTHSSFPFIDERVRFTGFNAYDAAIKLIGKPIVNTALLGALIAVSGIVDIESAAKAVLEDFGIKQAQKNVELLKYSWEIVKNGGNKKA